jgi:uncharacterized protein (TIGR02594 family)
MKNLFPILMLSGCVSVNVPSTTSIAARYVGMHEVVDNDALQSMLGIDPAVVEWCGGFVSYVLESAALPLADKPLWSRSYLDWGVEVTEPQYGDLVIFSREGSSWKGHVGFYIRDLGDTILVLGGNTDDKVSYGAYKKSNLLGFRRAL